MRMDCGMKNVRVRVDSDYVVYRPIDPEDDWDNGDDGYENHNFIVSGPDLKGYDYSVETDLEDPYFVFVIYGTGCTFGTTAGMTCMVNDSAYTKEEAEKIAELIEAHYDNNDKLVEYLKPEYAYFPWQGYFEWFQDVVVV